MLGSVVGGPEYPVVAVEALDIEVLVGQPAVGGGLPGPVLHVVGLVAPVLEADQFLLSDHAVQQNLGGHLTYLRQLDLLPIWELLLPVVYL